MNGYTFKDGDAFNINTIFLINLRLHGGTKATNEHYVQPYHPQILFLDSDGTPSSWFRIFEARTSSRLSSRTDLLLDSIPNELMSELGTDIADALDSKSPYDNLKLTILKKYQPDIATIFNRLTNPKPYCGQKPSLFLNNLIKDLENVHPGLSSNLPYVTHHFLKTIPSQIRQALLVVDSQDPFHLAKIADKLTLNYSEPKHLSIPPDRQISALNPVQNLPVQTPTTLVCYFHKTFRDMAKSCCLGCTWPNPSQHINITNTCIYHNLYGPKALKCITGCTSRYRNTDTTKPTHQKN